MLTHLRCQMDGGVRYTAWVTMAGRTKSRALHWNHNIHKMTIDHDDTFRQTERGALVSASYRRLRLRGLTVDLTTLGFLAFSNSGRREASLRDHARHPRSSSDLPGDENCCCQEGQGGREIKGIFAGPKPEKVNRGWRYFCLARCSDVETGIWGWRSRCRFVSVGSWA